MGFTEIKVALEAKRAEAKALEAQLAAAIPAEQVEDVGSGMARIAWGVAADGALVVRTVFQSSTLTALPPVALRRVADVLDALEAWRAGGPWPTVAPVKVEVAPRAMEADAPAPARAPRRAGKR